MVAAAIEPIAVAEAVRDTLDLFLHDHPELEEADVVVGECDGLAPDFILNINGVALRVSVAEIGA